MQADTSHRIVAKGFFDGLMPEPVLLVSEWADKHRYLAKGASPEPGLYKTSRTPYLRKIMDCLSSHSSYRKIVYKKSAQIGATEAGLNWIGYTIDNSPGSILCVMPTEAQAKRNSKMKVDPMIKATPRLNEKIETSSHKNATNTILQKDFPGGTLVMSGANSASGLRSMSVPNLMLDEVDAYPRNLEGEGTPIDLAVARTRTYPRSKVYIPSTPTVKDTSIIEDEYSKTDQHKFFVPCPHCGVADHLVWENMKWEGNDLAKSPATAYYQCPHCEGKIYEHHKRDMMLAGEWRPTKPENSSSEVIGFHSNSLVSLMYKWSTAVHDYLDCGNNANKIITFTNTVLGECSEPVGDAPKWEDIYNKAYGTSPVKPVPVHVKMITAGVDVQKDRLEIQIVGWGHGKRRWVIDYRVLIGPYNEEPVWNELAKIVDEFWIREDGLEMPLRLMAVDSGSWPSYVYDFCKKFSKSRVVPVKGQDKLDRIFGTPSAANKTEAGKNAGNVALYPVGSSYMKTELYGWLKLNKLDEDPLGPPGFCHIPKFQDKYFKGLVAEEERVKMVKGYARKEWYTVYERNEPLDTMNYARAAAAIAGLDRKDDQWLDQVADTYEKRTPKQPTDINKITLSNKEGGFWD